MAADITTGNTLDNRRLFQLVLDLRLPFTQLIDEHGFSWLHISLEVAGGHGYGPAPCLSQGVEYFVDEAGYVPAGGFWRGVVDGHLARNPLRKPRRTPVTLPVDTTDILAITGAVGGVQGLLQLLQWWFSRKATLRQGNAACRAGGSRRRGGVWACLRRVRRRLSARTPRGRCGGRARGFARQRRRRRLCRVRPGRFHTHTDRAAILQAIEEFKQAVAAIAAEP